MTMPVRVEQVESGIFELRMDSPDSRNGLDQQMTVGLMEALTALSQEPTLKVLLLAGLPDIFCSGATLETLDEIAAGNFAVKDLQLPAQLLSFPAPIIGVLEGPAVGGGLALAMYCDITVAAAERRYGFNFTALGFTPGMGMTALLPALIGPTLAAEMLLSARFYTGAELQGRGLFTHVLPAVEVYPFALDLALQMIDKPREVLALTKAALAAPRRKALGPALEQEDVMHRICFSKPETIAQIREMFA